MTWRDSQRDERLRWWSAVERSIVDMPPALSREVRLAAFDLAIRVSPTGQARDAFTGVGAFPLFSVGGWLAHDLGLIAGSHDPGHADGDVPLDGRGLFVAAVDLGLRDQVRERHFGLTSTDGSDAAALADALTVRAADALGLHADSINASSLAGDDRFPRWAGAARIVARSALADRARTDLRAGVESMLDALAAGFETLDDLATMHEDLLAGRVTGPIATVASAAGVPVDTAPDPTVILGALVLTGSIDTIRAEANRSFASAESIARDLSLPTFEAFISDVRVASISDRDVARPITIVRPPGDRAIAMAEGFLLSSSTGVTSQEVHREGMFGAPLVVSRFPTGLILEVLARHGHDVPSTVDSFIDARVDNGFRYYDHPASGVDADTVGLVLRLLPAATDPHRWDGAIDDVLDRLDAAVATSGTIPVWIHDPEACSPARPPEFDLGEHCGTVAAHLLFGLLDRDADRRRTTIEVGGDELLARIARDGSAVNVNYESAYALGALGRLVGHPGLADRPDRATARDCLRADLELQLDWNVDTPQRAASLAIACLELDAEELLDPRWRALIISSQRWDGSWPGEPLAIVPTHGRTVAWFADDALTSAICYDALVRTAPEG